LQNLINFRGRLKGAQLSCCLLFAGEDGWCKFFDQIMENDNSEEIDSAAATREARRRRILENSNKRLGKITGREHNEGKCRFKLKTAFSVISLTLLEIPKIPDIANGIYPDPELERDTFESAMPVAFAANGGLPNQDVFELLKSMQQNRTVQGASTQQQQQQQKTPETPFSRLVRSKVPVISIALLVYTLHALNLERFVGHSVFSMLVVWEIFEFFMTAFIIREPVPQNQIFVLLSMFLGLNPARIQQILKLFGLFHKILRDLAIFVFTFVLLHLAYSFGFKGESLNEILDKDFTTMFGLKNEL
jgi:hypothetical protein